MINVAIKALFFSTKRGVGVKNSGKLIMFVSAVAVLLIVCCFSYSCAARRALEQEIESTPRDPVSGIVLGAQPRTLAGSGKSACLLVHGWASSGLDFYDLPERLVEKGQTVRVIRLPGHGTTPPDLAEKCADDFISAVRDEFLRMNEEYREVTLIGFSMGGALSVIMASEQPVDRLVLVAPFFDITYRFYYILPPQVWSSMLAPFVDYIIKGRSFIRVNREEAKDEIFSYGVLPLRAVSVLCEVGDTARSPDLLAKVSCPVLLLQARGDMAASPEAASDAFSMIGSDDKELVLFERSNHHLLWDYDGPAAIDRIVEFVMKSPQED